MSDFVHLRTHSSHSIKDGIIDPTELPKMAAADGQDAIALTDLGLMVAAVDFYKSARDNKVKPLLGVDVWVEADVTNPVDETVTVNPPAPQYNRMVLLCQNHDGYIKLMHWLSRAYLDNQKKGVSAIRQSWMKDEGTGGLIALSGDMQHGEVAQAVLLEDPAAAREMASRSLKFYHAAFGDRYYLEIQRYNQPQEALQVSRLVHLARSTKIPLVATHPVQFAKAEDFFVHELRYCISNSEVINDAGRQPVFSPEQSFKSQAEMVELFADLPEAVANTKVVAQRCTVPLTLGKNFLPHFQTDDGSTAAEFMAKKSREGLAERLLADFPDPIEREKERPAYEERLEREIQTIAKMDFPGYFLIVADFINWAKDQGIPVGPGRGSGAGSLVAYALRITNINPLPYNLLFERFLNPERVSMPDFDIDFENARRDQVIAYVRQKYGDNSVSQISTLGTLGAKAALQGAARAFGVASQAKLVLSSLIPAKPLDITIHDALFGNEKKEIPIAKELRDRYDSEAEVHKIIDLAMQLEDLPVSVGKHASGLLISPSDISDFSPLYYDPSSSSAVPVSQYDYRSVEQAGLVKFDFLGLKTLDLIEMTTQNINKHAAQAGAKFNIEAIPLTDARTYETFARAETVGVFQFESAGMRRMLKNARPDRFGDIIALVALFRPGPLDLIPSFIARKHGREEVQYPDPRVEPILKETYGIMVYQEQVMQMAQIVGGYTLGGADLLRRAMGKKKVEEMVKHRAIFRDGAAKNGIPAEKADETFDLMEKFAGYGFNKSHAAAYALLAYQTAYLKTNYPNEFYTALINMQAGESQKHDKLDATIADARASGIRILPPDINNPSVLFETSPEGVRYGMSGLKGVSENSVEAIVEARKEGPFTSFIDFARRAISSQHINKRVIDALINVGAFDSIEPNRAMLLANVQAVVQYAGKYAKRRAKEEELLGAELDDLPPIEGDAAAKPKRKPRKKPATADDIAVPELEPAEPWGLVERLKAEHKVAGFYISGHPFDDLAKQFGGLQAALPLTQIDDIDPATETGLRLIAGEVADVYKGAQSNGGFYGRIRLADGEGQQTIMAFSSTFEPAEPWIQPGAYLAASVRIEKDRRPGEEGNNVKVDRLFQVDDLYGLLMDKIHVAIQPDRLDDLERVLAEHRHKPSPDQEGPTPLAHVRLHMPDSENPGNYLVSDLANCDLTPSAKLLRDLQAAFGESSVKPGFRKQVELVEAPRPGRRNNRNSRPR